MIRDLPLGFHEQVIYRLRSLYNRFGYTRYKMSKFEEYDLYARNKDFLISDSIITFMDLSGKLMALKPDVTLSIVKNSRDDRNTLQKLYYNENVYRVSRSSRSFREIMQVGLECLGPIDDCCIAEVLTLAAESLLAISPDSILDISHLGLLSQLIDAAGIPADRKEGILRVIGEKNLHELAAICRECGVPDSSAQLLKEAVSVSGPAQDVLPRLRNLLQNFTDTTGLDQLIRVVTALEPGKIGNMIRFDFSAVGDIHYYNGIVFKGYIPGLPSSVLSGGQYDKLMQKMNRKSGAIGFAVYMDTLERLDPHRKEYDVDTLLLYNPDIPLAEIESAARRLRLQGERVMVQPNLPENIRCRRVLTIGEDTI